jgi:carotenoid cleavage dioxygenase-like enzyme
VHATQFKDGRAHSYANHYLRCDRFVHEREAGQNIYVRVRCQTTTVSCVKFHDLEPSPETE